MHVLSAFRSPVHEKYVVDLGLLSHSQDRMVRFLSSLSPGPVPVPGCVGADMDISPPTWLGGVESDENGSAVLTIGGYRIVVLVEL